MNASKTFAALHQNPSTVHIKADFALLRTDCHVCVNFYQWH